MTPAQEFLQARDFLLRYREDYETAYRNFHWPELSEFNWALDYFDSLAQHNENIALWVVGEDGSEAKISFAEMSRRSNQVANFLSEQGVKRGDHILLMLPNRPELWEVMLGSMKLGAVVVPATVLLSREDLVDRLDRGRVKLIVAEVSAADKFEGVGDHARISVGGERVGWIPFQEASRSDWSFVPEAVTRAADPLLLYFTSGTTSKPKLVLHSHESYPVGHLSTMYWIGLRPGDIHFNISSPGWAKHAWSCFFAPWNAGATVFVYNQARFNPKAVLEEISRCGVTSLCAPPTVWRMLIQENLADYPVRLRELTSAGEPLNPEVIGQVQRAWNLTIREGYGQTETTAQIGNTPRQEVKPGSMGRPLPGYRVVLLDAGGQPAEEGEITLVLDPPPSGLMLGYQDDPLHSTEVEHTGRFPTGDLAQCDADGYLTFIGRTDDVFKASDYRISPFELESVLIEHDAVAEAAIVPSPDPIRSAVPKAFVALCDGYSPDRETALEIFKHSRARLAPYSRIRRLEFSGLPKTISGKIRRVELRERERASQARGPFEFWEEDFEEFTHGGRT